MDSPNASKILDSPRPVSIHTMLSVQLNFESFPKYFYKPRRLPNVDRHSNEQCHEHKVNIVALYNVQDSTLLHTTVVTL